MTHNKHELFDSLKTALQASFEDRKLDLKEKAQLLDDYIPLDAQQRAYVRNRAFELVAEVIDEESRRDSLRWLKAVVRVLDSSEPEPIHCESFFSPGEECINAITNSIRSAQLSLDICVFTISDNRISEAIIAARDRGVSVRIITDNDKTEDRGSDIEMMLQQGIHTRIDNTRHHMHHKFMVVDKVFLITGSFNWTRSASHYNHENIVVVNDKATAKRFVDEFERLWQTFSAG